MARVNRKFIPERLPPEPADSIGEMEDLMARTIVENLSLGINPMSGQALDDNDICANETVQEALRVVLKHCSLESYKTKVHERIQKKSKKKQLIPETHSFQHRVKIEEDCKLAQLCREGKSILEMAREMGCSTIVICEKLKRLGK